MIPAVPSEPADVRLPVSERSPLSVLLRRLGIAAGLVLVVSVVTYLDRDGFRDAAGDEIGVLDAFYFGAVSVTSTGYGDITPVTGGARLVNVLVVMPAGVLFLVILVSTTLEVLAARAPSIGRSAGGGPCRITPSSAATGSRAAQPSRRCAPMGPRRMRSS
jgi:voltage-gated potassium channel